MPQDRYARIHAEMDAVAPDAKPEAPKREAKIQINNFGDAVKVVGKFLGKQAIRLIWAIIVCGLFLAAFNTYVTPLQS